MTTPDIVLFVLLWGGAFVCFLMVALVVYAIKRNGTPTRITTLKPAGMSRPADVVQLRHVICNVRFPINS